MSIEYDITTRAVDAEDAPVKLGSRFCARSVVPEVVGTPDVDLRVAAVA